MVLVLVYFEKMRVLVLFLILAISAQPLQAGSCDMDVEHGQESSHHMEPSGLDGHDCCDPESTDSSEGCDGGMDCGFCFVSVSALSGPPRIAVFWSHHDMPETGSGVVLPSHSSPPFRPPIS